METSVLIAQFFGVTLLVMSVASIINFKTCGDRINELAKNKILFTVVAGIEFVLGLFLVLVHTVWGTAWQSIITIISWLMMIEGGLYLLLPISSGTHVIKAFNSKSWRVAGIIIGLILGLYLVNVGFWS